MPSPPTAATLGASSLGVWPRADALVVHSRHVIQRLLDEGTWQSPFRGVYADGGYELSCEQRAFAAVLTVLEIADSADAAVPPATTKAEECPRAVACGRDAARVWELPLIDDNDPATGAVEHLQHDVHTSSGLAVKHRQAPDDRQRTLTPHRLDLAQGDYVRRPSGLWVTTPLRTAWDGVSLLTPEALGCLLDNGLHRQLFSAADLWAVAASRAGVPGVRAFRKAVELADGRAEAPTETLARLLLLPSVPRLVPQVRVLDRHGRVVARLDLGDEAAKLAVEMDGKRGHSGDAMVAKDRRRDRRTEAYGWWTERGTWYDVRVRRVEFVDRVVTRHRTLTSRAA